MPGSLSPGDFRSPPATLFTQEYKQLQSMLDGGQKLRYQLDRAQQEATGLAERLDEARAASARVRQPAFACRRLPPLHLSGQGRQLGCPRPPVARSRATAARALQQPAVRLCRAAGLRCRRGCRIQRRWVPWSSSWGRRRASGSARSSARRSWKQRWVAGGKGPRGFAAAPSSTCSACQLPACHFKNFPLLSACSAYSVAFKAF